MTFCQACGAFGPNRTAIFHSGVAPYELGAQFRTIWLPKPAHCRFNEKYFALATSWLTAAVSLLDLSIQLLQLLNIVQELLRRMRLLGRVR